MDARVELGENRLKYATQHTGSTSSGSCKNSAEEKQKWSDSYTTKPRFDSQQPAHEMGADEQEW